MEKLITMKNMLTIIMFTTILTGIFTGYLITELIVKLIKL
jgi:hypothetical protein